MIEGVKIKQMKLWCDDRGFFTEVLKLDEETFHEIKQTSYSETYPGVIKAFHWHKKQWDVWFVVRGMAQVVLHDIRKESPTYKETNVHCVGEHNRLVIAIPPGVAHGYRVLGAERVGLFYHTTESYDPQNPDEERIPWDSAEIGFDWTTKNR
ncbi:MAG: dTDP-4-dehydrorhamnose 3,5-epimerase family protein [Patescibacteria group bacterium]